MKTVGIHRYHLMLIGIGLWLMPVMASWPVGPLEVEGQVESVESGIVFRFTTGGKDAFAIEDPLNRLEGRIGRRVRLLGEHTRNISNGLPVVRVTDVQAATGAEVRMAPLAHPAGPGFSRTRWCEELVFATRIRQRFTSSGQGTGGNPDRDGAGSHGRLNRR